MHGAYVLIRQAASLYGPKGSYAVCPKHDHFQKHEKYADARDWAHKHNRLHDENGWNYDE